MTQNHTKQLKKILRRGISQYITIQSSYIFFRNNKYIIKRGQHPITKSYKSKEKKNRKKKKQIQIQRELKNQMSKRWYKSFGPAPTLNISSMSAPIIGEWYYIVSEFSGVLHDTLKALVIPWDLNIPN